MSRSKSANRYEINRSKEQKTKVNNIKVLSRK